METSLENLFVDIGTQRVKCPSLLFKSLLYRLGL